MVDIESGKAYSKDEIEENFDYGFGFQIRGINRVTNENGDLDSIIVFSNNDGPYDDDINGSKFTYWGELQNGDYETAYNKGLIRSMVEDIPVHFFYKEESGDEWSYLGEVKVVGVNRDQDRDGRTNYKFEFEQKQK